MSDARAVDDGRIAFTATFDNRAPDQWSGQDWIVTATEAPPWNIPTQLLPDGVTPAAHLWFSGQVGPGSGTTSITYEFDLRGSRLAVRGEDGELTRPDQNIEFAVYTAAELTRDKFRNMWETFTSDWRWPVLAVDAAIGMMLITFIPALLVTAALRRRGSP